MRTQVFRLFAIVSMLALLFGAQLCMVVQCAPGKANSEAHSCCTRDVAKDGANDVANNDVAKGVANEVAESSSPDRSSPNASAKPCCIQVTTAAAPELQPPAAHEIRSLAAVLLAAQLVSAEPAATDASPPGDALAPHLAPPHSAAGPRAPPATA